MSQTKRKNFTGELTTGNPPIRGAAITPIPDAGMSRYYFNRDGS